MASPNLGTRIRAPREEVFAAFTSTFRFAEQDGGTQVDMETRTQALSFMAKVMAPLGFLMMGPMKKAMAEDMDDVKRALEWGSSA